jgi:hypothetical protein
MELFLKLLQEEVPVIRGLKGQYFVAFSVFKDLEAKISHGRKNIPDIISTQAVIANFITNIQSLPSNELEASIEVKTFNWNPYSFKGVYRSYTTRQQHRVPFVGLVPTMLLRRTPTPTFKNFETGIITGFVILIMSVDTKESATDLWSKVKLEAEKLVPADMEILELPVDRILEVLNFKKILQQEKLLESQGQAIQRQEQAMQRQEQAMQRQEQAMQRQEQAMQRQEQAMQSQEQTIQRQEQAIQGLKELLQRQGQAMQRQGQLLVELKDLLKESRAGSMLEQVGKESKQKKIGEVSENE